MPEILALCGSLRRASMNAALLRASARLVAPDISVAIDDGPGLLPFFNPDLENTPPASVRRFHAAAASCDAILIASPEYAHGVTAVLKNALDWLVGFEPFIEKRVAIFNASPRSVHADAALREILRTMSATIVEEACLELPLRSTGMDEETILRSGHGPAIRAALTALTGGPRP